MGRGYSQVRSMYEGVHSSPQSGSNTCVNGDSRKAGW